MRRLALLGAVFSFELIAITLWLDNASLAGSSGLTAFIGLHGAWILRACVGFLVFFLTFAWLRHRSEVEIFDSLGSHFSPGWLGLHGIGMAAFAGLSSLLYRTSASPLNSNAVAAFWLVSGVAAIVCGAFSMVQPAAWRRFAQGTGNLWMVAILAVVTACVIGNSSRDLWPWAADLTFRMTGWMLRPFVPDLILDPSKMLIGSRHFNVDIAPQCSGLEGIGLMLAFGVGWLIVFRKQCRFPHALLLLPVGAILIFVLNSVRIAALILIGNAGAEEIAIGGFHSQAGWIAFNLVALGFTVGSSSVPWLSRSGAGVSTVGRAENPTAAWLTPLVAILSAGMVSHALSGTFEWLYPLRVAAVMSALFVFRRTYARQNWRIDWSGPAIGIAVFALWIGLDRLFPSASASEPLALAAATNAARNGWLAVRVLAAVVTVPIAEELAFRGFLYRRLIAEDFEAVSLRRVSWFAVAASSIAFGIPHGSRWAAGAAAGALYAWAMLRRGSIGNAVAAHAVTNALIAADVLLFQKWNLW